MNFFNQLFLKARNPFIKNVSFLSFGTLISQLLLISAIPLLTRLYSPSDFGLLAIYLALTQFLGVFVCLRFNIAIPLSKDKRESSYLFLYSISSACILSLSASAVILFFDNQLITLLGNTEFKQFIFYIPLSMFFIGLYESLQYYVTKLGYFKLIASTRITRALLSIAFQLSYAFLYEPDAFGLIIGQIIYFASGILILLSRSLKTFNFSINIKYALETLERNKRFPLISVPESIMNKAGVELPIVIISTMVAGAEVGFLIMTMRIIGLPMNLIGLSVSQVLSAELPKQNKVSDLICLIKDTMKKLFFIGFLLIASISIILYFLSSLILGEEWERVGELAIIFMPFYVMQFTSSPVSTVLLYLKKFWMSFYLQAFGSFMKIFPLIFLGAIYVDSISNILAISGFIFYSIYCLVILMVLKNAAANK